MGAKSGRESAQKEATVVTTFKLASSTDKGKWGIFGQFQCLYIFVFRQITRRQVPI